MIQYLLDIIEQTAHKIAYDKCVIDDGEVGNVMRFSDKTWIKYAEKRSILGTGYSENVALNRNNETTDEERFRIICVQLVDKIKEYCSYFAYGNDFSADEFNEDIAENIPCNCRIHTTYFDVLIHLKDMNDDTIDFED